MSRKTVVGIAILVIALGLAAGCAKIPQADVDGATQAIQAAVTAEAGEYAPESLAAANDAETQLQAELKAQEEKFSLFRSYDKSKELAAAAKAAGEKAVADAAAGKERARQEATDTIAQARTALDEAKDLLAHAPKGKGTAMDLAMMGNDLSAVESGLGEASTLLEQGRYKDAAAKASAAKASAEQVSASVKAAIEAKAGKTRRT